MGKLKAVKWKTILSVALVIVFAYICWVGYQIQQMDIVESANIIKGGKVNDITYVNAEVKKTRPVNLVAPKDIRIEDMRISPGFSMGTGIPVFQLSEPITEEDYLISFRSKLEHVQLQIDKLDYNLSKAALNLGDERKTLEKLRADYQQGKTLYASGQYSKDQLDNLSFQITKQEVRVEGLAMDYELLEKTNAVNLIELEYQLKEVEQAIANQDPSTQIITDENGIYYSKESFLCNFVDTRKEIQEGTTILTYVSNERRNDVILVVKTDSSDIFEPALEEHLYFDIAGEAGQIDGYVKNVDTFMDYSEVTLELTTDEVEQRLQRIALSGKVIAKKDTFYRVNKSALLPISTFKKGEKAYLYTLDTQNGLFGKEYVIHKHEVTLTHIGQNMAGINFSKDVELKERVSSEENVLVVLYPDASYEDGQRIRLSEKE